MPMYLRIAVGSALGGMARYWCTGFAARMLGETFPWGTLLVNITGSLNHRLFRHPDRAGRPHLRKLHRAPVRHDRPVRRLHHFSAFSLQTLNLANDGEWLQAGGNIIGSVVLCLLAVWLGHILAVSINAMRWI